MTRSDVVVVGAGSMGLLLAAALADAGVPAALVVRRPETVAALRRGVAVTAAGGVKVVPVPATADAADLPAPEFAVVAVKSYDLAAALPAVVPWAAAGTTVVTWQNGLDAPDMAAAAVGEDRVLAAVTQQAATRTQPAAVSHLGDGPTWVGCPLGGPDARADQLASYLQAAGWEAAATADIASALWSKAAVNAAINPLSALLGWPNGRLGTSAPAQALMRELAEEVGAVAAAHGHPLEDPAARALAVAAATRDNLSSMLQDVRAGRPTEIEAITGSILRRAAAVHRDVPANRVVYQLIGALTAAPTFCP